FIKRKLSEVGLPVAPGKSFSFFGSWSARRYGNSLGFPLVVKPRFGSMSQHVTVNIKNEIGLREAIKKALRYSPHFIVEKFLENVSVFRVTVIDEEFVACVKRVPAHVIGDGIHTIQELIDIKNQDPRRGKPKQKDATIFKLVVDETSEKLLREKNFDLFSIPRVGEIVYLQEKVILDLGADLFEVTKDVHQDNLELFSCTVRLFGAKLVGIDFLAEDVTKSWKEQSCAIIELNSLPYIDMHHFPTEGEPVPVAKFLCGLVEKYY
ncbi:MAG: cyanophycin synthetase, partial [Patescibacteria group bacterium]